MVLTNAGTKAAMDDMQYGEVELLSSLAGVAPPPTDAPAGKFKYYNAKSNW